MGSGAVIIGLSNPSEDSFKCCVNINLIKDTTKDHKTDFISTLLSVTPVLC